MKTQTPETQKQEVTQTQQTQTRENRAMKTQNKGSMNQVRSLRLMSAVVGVLFVTGSAQAALLSIVVDNVAGLDAAFPTGSAGGATDFFLGNAGGAEVGRLLIDFDLSAIPAGSTIDSATLRIASAGEFFGHPGNFTTISIRRAQESWTTGATWNTKDGVTPWAAAGGGVLGGVDSSLTSDFEGSSFSRVDFSYTSLAPAVQTWVDTPASNYGFLIRNNDEVIASLRKWVLANWTVAGSGGGFGADFEGRPFLDVEFTAPVPEPTSLGLILLGSVLIAGKCFRKK